METDKTVQGLLGFMFFIVIIVIVIIGGFYIYNEGKEKGLEEWGKGFLRGREKEKLIKEICDYMSCEYKPDKKSWEYQVVPKHTGDVSTVVKYFPERKQCWDYCLKDMKKVEESFFDEMYEPIREQLFPEKKETE